MTTPEDLERLRAEAAEAERRADELAAALARAESQQAPAAAEGPAPDASAPEDLDPAPDASLSDHARTIAQGYRFEGSALHLGALVEDGAAVPAAQVRIPFGMLNRHGLVAGATGTGKTRTLQALAEQVAAGGVPVFAADIKGDLTGLMVPGQASQKLLERTSSIGQDWTPEACATEFFTLGGQGTGVPIRATLESFGSLLLSRVLGLNATQESSLALVFHWAKGRGIALRTLEDLRAVLVHLDGDGKPELRQIGGISSATIGVILRELVAFSAEGADAFFGSPAIAVTDFLRTTSDGRGVVSLLEVPGVQDKPAVFSTFLLYLLRELFEVLPEVGDTEKPKLVFFFDEAHLLFADASKDFLATVIQTVRLIRSKGVGVFFVTQTPKDVPSDVLAQLGSRIQHQLRAHTPQDAKALKAAVTTYPNSDYDLEEVLTQLATGEAIITVMSEKGAPTPVAWTRLRAPQASMDPAPAQQVAAAVAASPLMATYGLADAHEPPRFEAPASADAGQDRVAREAETFEKPPRRRTKRASTRMSAGERVVNEVARTATREVLKRIFGRRR